MHVGINLDPVAPPHLVRPRDSRESFRAGAQKTFDELSHIGPPNLSFGQISPPRGGFKCVRDNSGQGRQVPENPLPRSQFPTRPSRLHTLRLGSTHTPP